MSAKLFILVVPIRNNMANIKYYLPKGRGEEAAINIRFLHGRAYDFKKSIHYKIKRSHWNPEKQQLRNKADIPDRNNINNDLATLKAHIMERFNADYKKGVIISSNWLQTVIDNFYGQNNNSDLSLFTVYGRRYIESLENPKRPTILKYENIINKVRGFEAYQKSKVHLTDINPIFKKNFSTYLRNKEKLSHGTIGRAIGFIKTIANSAREDGMPVHPQLDKVKGSKQKGTFITLSEDEIKRIEYYDFRTTPYLDNARDWLIVGLWTGQRVSDFMRMTSKNIVNDRFIDIVQQKTGKPTRIPLHGSIKKVIDKNYGEFPRAISEQKFNDYIKEVCKDVGLTQLVKGARMNPQTRRKETGEFPKYELVSSHICRRSFATNHYGLLPTPVIMSITNHGTEKQFLTYIGKQQQDHAQILSEYWDKVEAEKEPTMKVTKMNVK